MCVGTHQMGSGRSPNRPGSPGVIMVDPWRLPAERVGRAGTVADYGGFGFQPLKASAARYMYLINQNLYIWL